MAKSKKFKTKAVANTDFNENRWQSVFENMSEIVMVIDRKFHILTMNHEQQGFTKANTIGKSLFNYVPPSKNKLVKSLLVQLINTGKSFEDENYIYGLDGTFAWYKTVYSPIHDSLGKVTEVIVISHDITNIKNAEDRVLRAVFDGQESERKRLSSELHDGLGQYVSAIGFGLFQLEKRIGNSNSSKIRVIMDDIKLMVMQAGSELKTVTHNLSPKNLEQYGLVKACKDYINQVAQMFNIKIRFSALNFTKRVSPDVEITLYRLVQELLNNIVKHAECTVAVIRLSKTSNSIILTVTDNGKGFNANSNFYGLGLQNIKNRVKPFMGSVDITSKNTKGTTILVSIPIRTDKQ
jgi:PAS domain S-box-containing protein